MDENTPIVVRRGDEVYDTAAATFVAKRNGLSLYIRDVGGAFFVSELHINFFGAPSVSHAIMPASPEQIIHWAKDNGAFAELLVVLPARVPLPKEKS